MPSVLRIFAVIQFILGVYFLIHMYLHSYLKFLGACSIYMYLRVGLYKSASVICMWYLFKVIHTFARFNVLVYLRMCLF